MNHDQENMPDVGQQFNQDEQGVQHANELDTVPTVQLDQQRNSYSSTESFVTKGEQVPQYLSHQNSRKIGRRELVVMLVILLFVLGAIVYAFAGFWGLALPGFFNTQPSIITTAINTSVPYAGVDITVLNVQRSQSFLNDPNSNSNGMVRLNLQERNQTDIKMAWSYVSIARLVLPNKSIVSPTYVNSLVNVSPGASQKSVIDFAVPTNVSLDQLTFVLGATNEAQMFIPLERNANVSTYQPKTTNLNGQMLYFGLNWTLTSATSSLSIKGLQAAKGMRYVTLLLKVDNTLSQIAITGTPYDYMRLHYGNTTTQPRYSSMPVSFQIGAVGVIGTVSFQVPQNIHSFTLILIPQKGDSGDQSSTDFHLS